MEQHFDQRKWPSHYVNNVLHTQSITGYNYPTTPSPRFSTPVDSSLSERWYYPTTPTNSVPSNHFLLSPKQDIIPTAMFPPALDMHPILRMPMVPTIPCLHESCACNKGERSKFRTSKNQREHHKKGWLHTNCSEKCKVCKELIKEGNLWKSIQDRKNRSDKTKLRRELTKKKRMEYQVQYSTLPVKRTISELDIVPHHPQPLTHHTPHLPLELPTQVSYLPTEQPIPVQQFEPNSNQAHHDMFAFTTPVFSADEHPLQFPSEDTALQPTQTNISSSNSSPSTSSSTTLSPEDDFAVHSFDTQYNNALFQPYSQDSYLPSTMPGSSQESHLEYHDILQWLEGSSHETANV